MGLSNERMKRLQLLLASVSTIFFSLVESSFGFFLGRPLHGRSSFAEPLTGGCGGWSGCGCYLVGRQASTILDTRTSLWTMKIQIGILGLPNVGKSSLFNALAQQSIAQAENFPFCTIDPNFAPIAIPDPYLDQLRNFALSDRTVPATLEWVDVAGLAKGAHRGEGLGNRFLGNLRDCDALCHVVRIFQDNTVAVAQMDGKVEPHKDIEAIHLELLFADIAHVERRLGKTNVPKDERAALEQVLEGMIEGLPARALGLSPEEKKCIKSMGLLTLKPIMYAFNIDEVDYALDRETLESQIIPDILQKVEYYNPRSDPWTVVSAKLETELCVIKDKPSYLQSLGVEDVDSILKCMSHHVLPTMAMELLGMALAYTGPGVPSEKSKTTRAHLFTKGLTAEGLAGRIHGDIKKGFIRAEVTPAPHLLRHDHYVSAKESGDVRTEGREYELQRYDVVLVKWR